MISLPLHRVATVLPYIAYMQQQGVQVEDELRRANLPVSAMYDPGCFIPSRNYWDFIANVAEREGMKDLGFIVGLQSGANAADLGLTKRLMRLPTLHEALNQFCTIASAEISQVALWLEPSDKNNHHLHYRTSYGIEHPAYVHFQWYGLMALIAVIRIFTGGLWQPKQIGLGTNKEPSLSIRKYIPDTHFYLKQEHCFISISKRLLGKPLKVKDDLPQSLPYNPGIKVPGDFIGRIKLALRSYLMDSVPTLKLVADITGLSTRTLQRQLANNGLTYRDLLAEVRCETAIELMQKTNLTITDIASQLGYSDGAHFARNFRRITGVSPHEYI